MRNRRNNYSKHVALGGICTALALCVMLVGGMFPLATFVVPIFASLFLVPIVFDLGTKTTLVSYFSVSILSFILVPDKEIAMFFLMLTGYYPALQPHLHKLGSRVARFFAKLILFNVSILLSTTLLLFVFAIPSLQQEFYAIAPWFWGLALLLGNLMFFLYDQMIEKVKIVYYYRIRKHFFR